jgi:bacterial/archaeal transporter family-2 protein
MTTPSVNVLLSLVMFATGVGIPIMAAANSRLGIEMGSPWAAAVMLFAVAGLVGVIVLAFQGLPKQGWFVAPPIYYVGGLCVAFNVLSVTWIAPRIGVGNSIFFVLLGQIIAAATIDQFGLFGAMKSPLTAQRLAGLAFMVIGTFLARRVV